MLTTATVPLYLIERGLLDTSSVTAGDVLVIDASRRNSNFKIISERGPSYLLKQGFGPRRVQGIANEAAIYTFLRQPHNTRHGLSRYIPALHLHDSEQHILVTGLLPHAHHLADHHAQTVRFSTRLAFDIGKALSLLHSTPITGNPPFAFPTPEPTPPPWVLSAHRATLGLYRQLSNANLQLIRILQQSPAVATLDDLYRKWQPTSLIHYDLKMENIVLAHHRRPFLVDWELAGLGDPMWDVGSILGEYLAAWLLSIPITGDGPPDGFLELARYPLSSIQPAMRALWQAYTQTAISTPHVVASYAAARLIQTAFERNQTSSVPTGEALSLLQVATNILARPHEAAVHLLGIPPVASWTTSRPAQ